MNNLDLQRLFTDCPYTVKKVGNEYTFKTDNDIVTTAVVSILCLTFGVILLRKGKIEEERKERNRERHKVKIEKGGK